MKITGIFFSSLIFSLIFLRSLPAAEETPVPHVLTFQEFCKKTLAYYPRLKQQNINVNIAIARKLQAVSGFLPRLQGITSVNHGDDPVFVFGSLLRENSFTQDNFSLSRLNTPGAHTNYNASLEAQFPIFDAFQTISRVRSAKLEIDSARFNEHFTKMEAFLVASEAYLRSIAVEKLLSLVTEVNRDSQEDIKESQDLQEKGLILGADFYSAKLISGNIRRLENQLAQEKQAAHILMNILMGEDPFISFEIQTDLSEDFQDAKTLKDWFREAYKLRPDLASIDKAIQAQRIDVSREKSSRLPRVDAFGEARDDTHNFKSNGGQNYLVGVKARVDIFDPAYSSRVRLSQEGLNKLETDKIVLEETISKDLANEFAHYRIAQENSLVLKKMLDDARQAVVFMVPLYRQGRKSIADLLSARFSYLDTFKEYYALIADSKASWSRLLFLSGQLNENRINNIVMNETKIEDAKLNF